MATRGRRTYASRAGIVMRILSRLVTASIGADPRARRRGPPESRNGRHLVGVLVGAAPGVGRVPHPPLRGPLGVLDLDDHLRVEPHGVDGVVTGWRRVEGALGDAHLGDRDRTARPR